MTMPFPIPFLLLLLSAFGTIVADGDEFDNVVSAKVADLNIRGAAIAYFDKNRMQAPVTRGYGKVSSEASSDDVTADTVFMLASVSKPFTAAAVAVLVDRGIIPSIDQDVCELLPPDNGDYSYEMCRNPQHPERPITWRMLLTHRSSMKRGIPEAKDESGAWISPGYGPSGGYADDAPAVGNPTCPLDNVFDFYHALLTSDPNANTGVGRGVALQGGTALDWYELAQSEGGMWEDYPPGERGEYSNAAYGYIPALIELATEQSFPDICREYLFDPLGMDATAWFREDLPDGTLEATPVETTNQGYKDIGHYCFIDYASGSLRTSANDLSRWGDAMLEHGTALWSGETGREVVSCQERNANDEAIDPTDCEFGYGWILLRNSMKGRRRLQPSNAEFDDGFDDDFSSTHSPTLAPTSKGTSVTSTTTSSSDGSLGWLEAFTDYDWTDGIMHDGSESGSQTNLIILPRAGVYVAVVTNTDGNSGTAAQELTEAVIGAPLPSSRAPPLTGFTPVSTEFLKEASSSLTSVSSIMVGITALATASRLVTEFFL